ncbi:hypothetical protein GO988_02765 [Hymenobacter sp. HMF4947]|uniref:Uncharacterized protein n=1 Tax=Hymenobacter ginkgonis TaxID=2682976 RepID=A0A7K1TA03_9BACT|nr:hypothetical protein [Hymenobacter ginkgonis]MVN75238.1 hypothetical protein [Hymenobacter ginkgonis]
MPLFIAAFLHRNGGLYRPVGSRRPTAHALVARALCIAGRRAKAKIVMATLVLNLIIGKN